MIKFILKLSILLFSSQSFSAYTTYELTDFEQVFDFTIDSVHSNGASNQLVVFDIDKTLLETIDCLSPNKKFSNGFFKFEETVNKCDAVVTSPLAVELINELKNLNLSVMALTARRSKILKGTLAQLEERLLINEDDNTKTMISFETSPLYSKRKFSIDFDQITKKGITSTKTLVVKKGVAFASGANKGLALLAYLRKVEKKEGINYNKIIFIDDDKKNIRNLEKAFKNNDKNISIIHYTEFSK